MIQILFKKLQLAAAIILVSSSCFGQVDGSKGKESAALTVNTEKKIYPIHRDFWGTNFLNWVDDDAALSNGRIANYLEDLKIGVLRFPGGTVADNYH